MADAKRSERGLDISHILSGWEHKSDEMNVRRIVGDDNREKIQMRLDLGLLQMEAEGRPDGKRPYGFESLLDYQLDALRRYEERKGTGEGWRLSPEEASKLRQEALQYYHRYLSFFFLEDWVALVRDTARNLAMFDLLWAHGPEEDKWSSEQYRPYVLMMNTRGKVSLSLQERDYDLALKQLQGGIAAIEAFYEQHGRAELVAESQELQFLREWAEKVEQRKPLTPREKLQKALDEAVRVEAYEQAAQLRDALRALDAAKV
jgi:hypothetical protein